MNRAQDLSSARNILADIVQGIEGATIVVADLTDLNPNVFYEVGIAHALQKPVILLTQDIDSSSLSTSSSTARSCTRSTLIKLTSSRVS